MTEGKRKLEWRRVRKYIYVFKFCSSPDPAIVKKPFHGFWKFYYKTFLMNLDNFSYFDPIKNMQKKCYEFQRHSLLTALHEKNLRMHTMYLLVLVFGHCWSVGLMKSKIVKVKSFYNYLINHLPAITEISIFLGHPICTLGCPKMHLFPRNIPWPGARGSLSDVGFENIYVFFFYFFHPPSEQL